MKRSDFLKSFGLGGAGLIIPKTTLIQQPIKIYENYAQGLFHYSFDAVKNQLKVGEELTLLAETTNTYDKYAVAIYYKGKKLGCLPAYENIAISNLLVQHLKLVAFITHLDVKDLYNGIALEVLAEIVVEKNNAILPTTLALPSDDIDVKYRS